MELRRVSALALAVGLLSGCGSDDGADQGAGPTSVDSGYGAPADSSSAATTATTSATETETAEGAAPAGEVLIVISDYAFDVPTSVPAGATITVRNEDGVGHTVTSDDDGAAFDVTVGPGEEATFTAPAQAGEFPFHCTPHPQMTATLVVEEG